MTGRSSVLLAFLLLLAPPGKASPSVASPIIDNQPDSAAVPFVCPSDCVCKNALTVDCRGSGVANITNFLYRQPVTKL